MVPPLLSTVFENQNFFSDSSFYDGTTPITGITAINTQYAFFTEANGGDGTLVTTWLPLPAGVSSQVNTYAGYQDFRLQGSWGKFTNNSDWTVRREAADSSQTSYATYELVEPGYFAAQEYQADPAAGTSVIIRITITGGGGAYNGSMFYIPQTINNNWTRKRNQVIPFVQGGSSDATTFRFPGGSLGGSVGQDLPEPSAAVGLSLIPVTLEYTAGSGTFVVPENVSSITISLLGAGGSGGRGYAFSDYNGSGGGGGGGGFLETTISVSTGQQFSWSVGEAGSFNSTNRGQGGSTSFGPYSVSGGGVGGDGVRAVSNTRNPPGGSAGQPAGKVGNNGSFGATTADQVGGDGADAIDQNLGQGGNGGNKNALWGVAGQTGTGFGAGGGGGGTARGTVSPWLGGDGRSGRIVLKYNGRRFLFVDTITANTADYDVRTEAEAFGWDGQTPLDATITILAGIYVYSTTTSEPAFKYAGLPDNTIVKLINNGSIIGKGGNGGTGLSNGQNGGPAIVLNSLPLYLTNTASGFIAGGGGGGGGGNDPFAGLVPTTANAGGGGGAGGGNGGAGMTFPLNGGQPSNSAGGAGGLPGQVGSTGSGASAAGGGGGRVTPGTAGAGAQAVAGALSGTAVPGTGGGAGGGGGAFAFDGTLQPAAGRAGSGGAANANGGDATQATRFGPNFDGAAAAGGGGGWGAAGGRGMRPISTFITTGGLGGSAIDTQGFDVYFSSNAGTIYGAVGGYGPITGTYSTAVFTNQTNFNLRTYAVNNAWDQQATAVITIAGGVYIYSITAASPALFVGGSWPRGVRINNYGFIIGLGGAGARSDYNAAPAGNGSTAMEITTPIAMFNAGFIAGGGGGGAGGSIGGGGGGAGGGAGGLSIGRTQSLTPYNVAGGAGGGPGATGGNGGVALDQYFQDTPKSSGGGGGRILPGAGGSRGMPASGGGAGGGGGDGSAFFGYSPGGNGGSANAAGASFVRNNTENGGGGGGGWGAAGGGVRSFYGPNFGAPGSGGRCQTLNGNTITYFRVGTLYGAIV